MTRQPSTHPQHRVLRGRAVLPLGSRPAGYHGMWPYQGRWRD